ncbi:MAG: NUDIX hydrolase N-terminal domain-containing protein [Anaerolineaceae bacterium]|nr:NUDIX hydrolase N-terminal domain-containing protein [Anaerolineaceae bacterium]
MSNPQWLEWAQRLQALAQSGLAYNQDNPFAVERYQAVPEIAAGMIASQSDLAKAQVRPCLPDKPATPPPRSMYAALSFARTRSSWSRSCPTAAGPCPAAGLMSMTLPAKRSNAKSGKNPASKSKQIRCSPFTTATVRGTPPTSSISTRSSFTVNYSVGMLLTA